MSKSIHRRKPREATGRALEASKRQETGPLAIVGGCGHVGLPLGLAFASKNFQVHLVDTSAERVGCVNAGRMPFHEDDAEDLLSDVLKSSRLAATTNMAILREVSAVIVTIGTPVDEYLDPSVGTFDRAIQVLLGSLKRGALLILRSTVFPGMTDRLARQIEQMGRGDIDLAYCPERIVQGKSLVELEQLPQLVGGATPRAG